MTVILGLILLIAAVVVGVAGVVTNAGSAHALTHGFSVFSYHMTGSTGTLFLYGIVVGAVAVIGLSLILTRVSRASRRHHAASRGLEQPPRETAAAGRDRDDLVDQRETPRTQTANARGDDSPRGHRHRLHLFGH
ncbi:hypothetical protein [Streptomyces sp. DB-54]